MSTKWIDKMHALVPLTNQEEAVKEVLQQLHFEYKVHTIFPFGNRAIVPDFFLPRHNLVIECWMSESRRGVALGWAERNAAFIDLKFRRLKENYLGISRLGLVELRQVDLGSLQEVVGPIMAHSDFMLYSMRELEP